MKQLSSIGLDLEVTASVQADAYIECTVSLVTHLPGRSDRDVSAHAMAPSHQLGQGFGRVRSKSPKGFDPDVSIVEIYGVARKPCDEQ